MTSMGIDGNTEAAYCRRCREAASAHWRSSRTISAALAADS
jgi:uncharacterized paraquat-inducible protein A